MLRRRVIVNKKKQLITFAVTLVVIVAAFFAILNYFVHLQQPPTSSAEHTVGTLRYSLDMPRANFGSEDVVVRLSVKNTGDRDVKMVFTNELEFDLIVQKEINLVFVTIPLDIWIYSSCHQNLPKPHVLTLKSQETKTYEASWPQVNSKGDKVSPGRYILTGVLDVEHHRQALVLRGASH